MKGRYEDQVQARRLRSEGFTIKEICHSVSASKGSVSAWVKETEVKPENLERLRLKEKEYKNITQLKEAAKVWTKQCSDKRNVWREEGRRMAIKNNADHAIFCSLYWAEGSKNRNMFEFANSDAGMMRLVISSAKKYFDLSGEDFSAKVHFYENGSLTVSAVEKYWGDIIGVSVNWKKHVINPLNKNKVKDCDRKNHFNKLPYGVCYVRIKKSTRIVQHIFGALEMYSDQKTIINP